MIYTLATRCVIFMSGVSFDFALRSFRSHVAGQINYVA